MSQDDRMELSHYFSLQRIDVKRVEVFIDERRM